MSNHTDASKGSKDLCDGLYSYIRSRVPDLQRSQAQKWCGYFEKGNKRFAYVNHRKEQNRIEVWFLREVDDESKYPHIDIQVRMPTSGGFGRDFGARFFLDSQNLVPEAGKLLLNVSHAASLKA